VNTLYCILSPLKRSGKLKNLRKFDRMYSSIHSLRLLLRKLNIRSEDKLSELAWRI
jgi:hypothetical protein